MDVFMQLNTVRADLLVAEKRAEDAENESAEAKPQGEMETCACGREYRAADEKLIPPKLDEIPVCPACFDEWEESMMY